MALAATTLAAEKSTASQTLITLTSATGATAGMLALVDGEVMRITDVSLTPTIQVVPGYAGTTAGPHGVLAPVIYGLPIDWPSVGGPETRSYGANGAIDPPVVDTVIFLTKATAGAYTLVGPTFKSQQNTVTFISTTAAAHTVTYTAGYYQNTTTSDVLTFPATANAMFTMRANNGTWAPVATADDGCTIG